MHSLPQHTHPSTAGQRGQQGLNYLGNVRFDALPVGRACHRGDDYTPRPREAGRALAPFI